MRSFLSWMSIKDAVSISALLLICVLMIVSYTMEPVDWRSSDADSKHVTERADIIKQNTEIIKSLGGCAATSTVITDLLLRVSHYTGEHKKGDQLCPECTGEDTKVVEKYFAERSEEKEESSPGKLKPTHKQVMQDLREIESSIDSITFGHLNQMKHLESKLLKYRTKSMLSSIPSFGGDSE